jgi:hypothetical protein
VELKSPYFFYRNSYQCLLLQDERSQYWIGLIGFKPEHDEYGSTYKVIANRGMAHYTLTELLASQHVNRQLWYLGFTSTPWSAEKTIEDLKRIVDSLD